MRAVEERAALPGYVWDGERLPVPLPARGEVATLGATFGSSIAATERRIASLF